MNYKEVKQFLQDIHKIDIRELNGDTLIFSEFPNTIFDDSDEFIDIDKVSECGFCYDNDDYPRMTKVDDNTLKYQGYNYGLKYYNTHTIKVER